MILVTGGLGFIGQHVTRSLLDHGETCVVTQYRAKRPPSLFKNEIGSRVLVEPMDVTDTAGFVSLGRKYKIDGIVHLAGGFSPQGPFEDIRANMVGLANALQAAHEWQVRRILVASALGVYSGVTQIPWREDQPLAFAASSPIEAFKKAGEIFSSYTANFLHLDCITMRIAAVYGPLYDSTRGGLVGRLVHAAVNGTKPSLENIRWPIYAQDGADQCYVKDTARAIALLTVADKLHHQTYNVASGRPTTNHQVVDAIQQVIPEAEIELPRAPNPSPVPYQDITWLNEDTGFEPQFTTESGIADYIAWLRAGNAM